MNQLMVLLEDQNFSFSVLDRVYGLFANLVLCLMVQRILCVRRTENGILQNSQLVSVSS